MTQIETVRDPWGREKPRFDKFGVEILRTPNVDCAACAEQRQHGPEEMKQFHPLAGTVHRAPGKWCA
jgi:hypothetical protein